MNIELLKRLREDNNININNKHYNNIYNSYDQTLINNKKYKNNNEIKLNILIYIEIQYYLIYNQPFQRLLELSLINKSSFKSIQYYITHKQKQIKFYFEINKFLNYINASQSPIIKQSSLEQLHPTTTTTINYKQCNNYDYKLIQFKNMKKINFLNIQDEDYTKLKNKLKQICGNSLEKVIFRDYYFVNSYDINPTIDNFYQFNKLSLYWDKSQPPYSQYERNNQLNYYRHIYSFDYLKLYNKSKKIKISSARKDMDLHLSNLDNLLYKSSDKLKSIKFDFTATPYKFVLLSLEIKSLKSLTVRLGNFNFNFNSSNNNNNYISNNIYNNGFSFDEEDEDYNNNISYENQFQLYGNSDDNSNDGNNKDCNTSEMVGELFKKSNIINNNSLEKLKLKKCIEYIESPLNNNPNQFLTSLIGNKSIKKLGLELFDLKESNSYKLLSPLINIPNISTLYCNYESIEQFLLHCNENSNIKILCLVNDSNATTYIEYNPNVFNILSNFFKNNKSSLQYLIIDNIFYDNDINNLITNQNNNINNNLKIIIKQNNI